MRAGLVDAIARGWYAPRAAMAREIARVPSEGRALVHLTIACVLFLVASLPGAIRRSQAAAVPDPLEGVVAAHVFAWLAVAPLAAYGFAAVVHLVARVFGGRAGFAGARAAVFWWALLVAPLTLGLAALGAIAERAAPALLPLAPWLGYAVLGFSLWLLASTVAEAEGFASTVAVAALVTASYLVIVAAIAIGNFGA
jgi:hypothetical protein